MEIGKNTLAYFEGENSPSFHFFVEKAQVGASSNDEELIIEGIASTTNVDHDLERMSESALKGMARIINEKSVPLRVEHQKDENSIIGEVFEARVDERNRLAIKARLNKDHAVARMLYDALKSGTKLGLSVGGRVKSAVRELAEGFGKYVKTFYDVILDEVSVTPRPANYDAWLVNKSIAKDVNDAANYYDNFTFYSSFLHDNPQLDYINAIEKSIPEKAWVKVENTEKIEMNKEVKKDATTEEEVKAEQTETVEEKAEETTETVEEKAAEETSTVEEKAEETVEEKAEETAEEEKKAEETDSEETATKSYVDGRFNEVVSLLNEIKKDIVQPGTQDEANGTTEAEGEHVAEKEETEEVPTASTEEKSVTEETEEKAEDTSTETVEEKKEESTEEETKYGEDYEMDANARKSIESAIARGVHPLDAFVAYVTTQVNASVESFAKSGGKRVLGFESRIADAIRHTPEIQKMIKEYMNVPGSKKSVSLGSPYMVTKTGERYRLVAENVTSVQKSESPKDFKELYKTQLSSTATGEVK